MKNPLMKLSFAIRLLAGIACTLLASLPSTAAAIPASDTATAIRVSLPSAVEGPATSTLRVCADPNNLPFSNKAGEGFENRIAQILARDLHAKLEYTWWAQRRGFARNTVRADRCDIWVGVASGVQTLATTQPYYRSTYVFVTREDRKLDIRSFDDPRLRSLRIGVQMIGNDAQNTPPAHALARRGIVDNVRGFMVYGDYAKPSPQAPIVAAVANGDIDVAVVWGPLAGYFARHSDAELRLDPVEPPFDGPQLPMAFDISVGVRRDDPALRERIEQALARERVAIGRVLDHYGVPRSRPVGGAGAVAQVQ
jgi:mxaJ protein